MANKAKTVVDGVKKVIGAPVKVGGALFDNVIDEKVMSDKNAAFGQKVDQQQVLDTLHPQFSPADDANVQAALDVQRVDDFIDPSRTDYRNMSLDYLNSTDDIVKYVKTAREMDEPIPFDDLPLDVQDHLVKADYMDKLAKGKGEQIGALSTNKQTHAETMTKARDLIGESNAIWLDTQKTDKSSPLNDSNNPMILDPDTPEAQQWRKRYVQATNDTYSLVDILGKEAGHVEEMAQKGRGQWNLEEVQGAKILLVKGGNELHEEATRLSAKGNLSDEEAWNFRKKLSRYNALGKSVEGAVNEAAKIVNASKIPVGSQKFQLDEMQYRLAQLGGAKGTEKLIKSIAAGNGDVKHIYGVADKWSASNFFDGVHEHYVSQGIFFDPTVHEYNVKGSATHTLAGTVSNYGAGAIGSLRRLYSDSPRAKDGATFGEANAYAYGIFKGITETRESFRKGWRAALADGMVTKDGAYKDVAAPRFIETAQSSFNNRMIGVSADSILGRGFNFYGKYGVRTGRGMIMGIDQVFRNMNKQAERNRLIYSRLTKDEGLEPYSKEFNERANSILQGTDPQYSRQIDEESTDHASRMVFQDRTNDTAMNLVRAANQVPAVRYLTMFAQTADNMFWASLEYSPAAYLSPKIKADWQKGGAARDLVLAKAGAGSLYMASVVMTALSAERVDKDGNAVRNPLVSVGAGMPYSKKSNRERLGVKAGTLNFAKRNSDGELTGTYTQVDLKRLGSVGLSMVMMTQSVEMAMAITNKEDRTNAITSIAIAMGDMFGEYSALGAFAEMGAIMEGRAEVTDIPIGVLATMFPIVSSGAGRRGRIMDDNTRRQQNLSGSNTANVFDQFNLAMTELQMKINNRIPSSVAKKLGFDKLGFGGSETLDPSITALGSEHAYTSPVVHGMFADPDKYVMTHGWEDYREPEILLAAEQIGYNLAPPRRTMNYKIEQGDNVGFNVALNLDLIDVNMIKNMKENNDKGADSYSPTKTYTAWSRFAGKRLRDDLHTLITDEGYKALPHRNGGMADQYAQMVKVVTMSRENSKELFLKENPTIKNMLEREANRLIAEGSVSYSVPESLDVKTYKVGDGTVERDNIEQKQKQANQNDQVGM